LKRGEELGNYAGTGFKVEHIFSGRVGVNLFLAHIYSGLLEKKKSAPPPPPVIAA